MWDYDDPSKMFDSVFFSKLEHYLMRTPDPPTSQSLGFFAKVFTSDYRSKKRSEQSGNVCDPILDGPGVNEHLDSVNSLDHVPQRLSSPRLRQHYEQVRQRVMQRHPHQPPIPDNVRQFVLKHYAEAQKIATQLGNDITAAEVLAVSGNESTWGSLDPKKPGLARFGNYFGLHGHGPAGTYNTTGKPSVPTPIFPITAADDGFKASGQEFVKLVKQKVLLTPGIGDDPKAFLMLCTKALSMQRPIPIMLPIWFPLTPEGNTSLSNSV
jgi:hypothetical protein